MKRLLGVVTMLLMLHLTLVRTDLVCAEHAAATAPAAGGQATAANGHHHGADQQSGDAQQERETPASTERCATLTSCATSVAVTVATIADERPARPTAQPADRATSLASRIEAPETPPPRA